MSTLKSCDIAVKVTAPRCSIDIEISGKAGPPVDGGDNPRSLSELRNADERILSFWRTIIEVTAATAPTTGKIHLSYWERTFPLKYQITPSTANTAASA